MLALLAAGAARNQTEAVMYLLGKAKQRESESGGRSRQRRRQRSQAVNSSDGMLEEAGREYAEAEEVVVRLERRRVWIPDRL